MTRIFLFFFLLLLSSYSFAKNIVNVYAWSGEIPAHLIRQFEEKTGITVNFSEFDSNENMYAKLLVSQVPLFDVIQPSHYFVTRLRKQNLLAKLDKTKIPNHKNIAPFFRHLAHDPENSYSVPFYWGTTGLFFNDKVYKMGSIKSWSDLWQKKYRDQLLLLNDPREVFSVALLTLGYSINSANPQELKKAYLRLLQLLPNVKVFTLNSLQAIMVDEDVSIGMAWNGDFFKARQENPHLQFVYPKEGFPIWIECFAIPKGAAHYDNALKFINFMLNAKNSAMASLESGYATTNAAAIAYLPNHIRNNPILYPTPKTLRRGYFQANINREVLINYEKYWTLLKIQN